jgi:dienelactone hydrolase
MRRDTPQRRSHAAVPAASGCRYPRIASTAALTLLAAALAGCGDRAPATVPGEVAPDGRFAVGELRFRFIDPSRPTAANGPSPGRSSRILPTLVFYPGVGEPGGPARAGIPAVPAAGPFPLVVFAHGFGGVADVYRGLLTEIAAAGYVVAAPDFPLTNGLVEGGPVLDDYVHQPGDLSFVIDEMLRQGHDAASGLVGSIDDVEIGAAGQSLGGITVFGLAFNSCCADPRIRAAVPMAGRLSPYPGEYFRTSGPPLLIAHGDADDTVPYASAVEAFERAPRPVLLLTLLGGDHIRPYVTVGARRPTFDATVAATIAFFDHFLKHERGALARLLAVDEMAAARLETRIE